MKYCPSISESLILPNMVCHTTYTLSKKCRRSKSSIINPKKHLITLRLHGQRESEFFGIFLVFIVQRGWIKNVGSNILLLSKPSLESLEWLVACAVIYKVYVFWDVIMDGSIVYCNRQTIKGFIWWLLSRLVNQPILLVWVF